MDLTNRYIKLLYYVNTSEIPGKLSRVNTISSHMKITEERRSPLLLLHNSLKKYLDVFLYDQNIIGSSSEIFGYLRKCSEYVRKPLSGLRTTFGESSEIFGKCWETFAKSSKFLHKYVYLINRIIHGCT